MARIDLHTHSGASDGSDRPAELVKKAVEAGIQALALTDHDTTAGLDEAEEAAGNAMMFIRGCEISLSSTEFGKMHLLGLWLPRETPALNALLAEMRQRRDERNRVMLEKLENLGIRIREEVFEARAGAVLGRPHIAAALVAKGYVENIRAAFTDYLGENGAAWVPKRPVEPATALKILKSLGATTVYAHPLLKPMPEQVFMERAAKLAANGLDALEAWHSAHNSGQTASIVAIARRLGLGISGGSDYHGALKPEIKLGETGAGSPPPDILGNLLNMRRSKGLPC